MPGHEASCKWPRCFQVREAALRCWRFLPWPGAGTNAAPVTCHGHVTARCPQAAISLGQMYEAGLGGPADPARARELFRLVGRVGGDAAVAAAAAETVSEVREAVTAALETARAFLRSIFG